MKISKVKNNVQIKQGIERKLIFARRNDKNIISLKKIKSDLTTTAQITTLCEPDSELMLSVEECLRKFEALKQYSVEVWRVANLLLDCGCRISEALNISAGDILINGSVVIRGVKRSSDRIVSCSVIREYLLECRANNVRPFEGLNRYYVYRVFDKHGIHISFKKSGKRAVTHALRHIYIKYAEQATSLKTTQTAIGHKSIASTKHYVDKS